MSEAYTPADFAGLNAQALANEAAGFQEQVRRLRPLVDEAHRAAGLLAQELATARAGLTLALAEQDRRTREGR